MKLNYPTWRVASCLCMCLLILGRGRISHAQSRFPAIRGAIQQFQQNQNGPNGQFGNDSFNPRKDLIPLQTKSELLSDDSIKNLVKPLADVIAPRPPGGAPYRIAVFPFGDKKGEIPEGLVDIALDTQGAINSALRKQLMAQSPGKFVMLDKFALQREFARAGVDPASVSPSNAELPKTLAELDIDAAVVGTLEGVGFSASIVFAKKAQPLATIKAALETSDVETSQFMGMQKRIGVSLQCRKGEKFAWEHVPLLKDKTAFSGSLYAEIAPHQTNYEFRVFVKNNGARIGKTGSYPGGIANPNEIEEQNRLFGVAVLIDGVNSFYENTGNGERGPVALHPRDAKKWLIGPPDRLIKAAPDGTPRVHPAGGSADHSTVAVKGFQDGDKFARAFQFTKVNAKGKDRAVVAEALGISQSIGLISVFIFSEKLAGDKQIGAMAAGPGKPSLGAGAGREFANPVVNLKVDFHRQPVEQFHIHYRLAHEIPFPRSNWEVLN